ncbi:MAG: S-adenosylmethionine synthase [Candidatus Roizmanbacteria bacterium GW2011_GWA2_36_23]|uniref:Methionine adenosyltransferase n=1 Tax=Candidatus Roizmanbacteria bacterium GW2011_GWA2_36_23 TaxID=1618480 RepID=A0A0G0HCW4_9BACT|nr:MAG: S-adenosylmethionine synthase [Candidatus Roizmanbacteria bacterium GW2011_GWA2_36_23]
MSKTFTSESVCSGHPDKICDQISDAILDAAIVNDKYSRVAVETLVTKNYITLAGEVTTKGKIDYVNIVRKALKQLGYTLSKYQFTYKSPVIVKIHTQSTEIARGVNGDGAGDQGIMYGYACDDTKSLMPLPIELAHSIAQKIDQYRENNILTYLRPDGKTQATIIYDNGKPLDIQDIVIAVPHDESISLENLKQSLFDHIVSPVVEEYGFKISKKQLIVNGAGTWYLGGPISDTGVTGRKIIVDTYGGMARHGGGCFSGKDPTKVDRSGAYAARFLAKNIVANNLAKKAEVRLAYFIGAKKPVMQEVETFGTAKKSDKLIKDFMNKILDTSVKGILNDLDLFQPIYFKTATYGHFGRDIFPWEKIIQ